MAKRVDLNLPINRVEGDLEIRVELTDGVVSEAWCAGTMFRGFERLLRGRGALDGLVITPRICGICSTAHLIAAARALDSIADVALPPDAVRVRNVALMAEHVQSDVRASFLIFAPDLASPRYAEQPLYAEAVRRYQPLAGEVGIEALRATKGLPEMIAVLGGQWPHSTFAIPGGVASAPTSNDLQLCRTLLTKFRRWYEQRVLGCSLERWSEVRQASDLDAWLEECEAHQAGELGFFLRYGRAIGLDDLGRAHGNFLSYGYLDLPEGSAVRGPRTEARLVPAGFAEGVNAKWFDQGKITEHVHHAWFAGEPGGVHPLDGSTEPYATGRESHKYSWAKAPRYDGQPAETGPLAEMVVAGHPLMTDLVVSGGASVLHRQVARLIRPAAFLPPMMSWLEEMTGAGPYYQRPGRLLDGEGIGLTHAARGALGHWVRLEQGKIAHYQVITPTAWHASPRDTDGVRGCTEEALVGTPVRDAANPVELGHVIRSFDHCLVCTVHWLEQDRGDRRGTVTFSP